MRYKIVIKDIKVRCMFVQCLAFNLALVTYYASLAGYVSRTFIIPEYIVSVASSGDAPGVCVCKFSGVFCTLFKTSCPYLLEN